MYHPKSSVGQNVSIILAGKCCNVKKMKIYEPNDSINMIGVRLEVKNNGIRVYTAHMKQQSTSSRDEIKIQMDEIRNQFRSSNMGCEPMLLVCDANVHVGNEGIRSCGDVQDWGGKEFLNMLDEEGLVLVNSLELCEGVVTRVDPRNGTMSTIDLAVCNTYMIDKIRGMRIDEQGDLQLKKYGKTVTHTDHNTIIIKLNIESKRQAGSNKVRYNTSNLDCRERMKEVIANDEVIPHLFCDPLSDINLEVEKLLCRWDSALKSSFHVVKPNKSTLRGVNPEIKLLLDEERWIRENVQVNPERGKRIAEVQMKIAAKIAENMAEEMEHKVNKVIKSDRPQSKVFSVRRKFKQTTNIDFPLKDCNGVVQVSKEAIDQIISAHFKKVFAQNEVSKEDSWDRYWICVNEVFELIDHVTKDMYNSDDEPKLSEIEEIVKGLKESKASYGSMSIDLVKLCDVTMVHIIHRCILMCFQQNVFPDCLQNEQMTLLLKSKGKIDNINDYRGIFLRSIIVSVYQKWLYQRNAPVVDQNGSEFACGGRKERSGMEALLTVKLIQDYANWQKITMILKFLDVEKFFDSMNFKKTLIEAYKYGIDGRFWQTYKTINERRRCIPQIPSGTCSSIEMNEIFVQGSCDAVLMAWPIMDAESKREKDCFSSSCCIEGIQIDQLSFVDDLVEMSKSANGTNEKSISNEVFEKKTRLNFKTCKCKVLPMNLKESVKFYLDGDVMEEVDDHVYLGTIISKNGDRRKDMEDRLKKANSVSNEIVQICKETELSSVRLRYVKLLITSCLDSKIKYGCALWNVIKSKKAIEDINKIKPALVKRVLQLPQSTPSDAILYEFGINELSLEILLEKIILAIDVLNKDDDRVAKKLLTELLPKNVNGFCSELSDACRMLKLSLDDFKGVADVRSKLKTRLIAIQATELYKRMVVSSKMEKVVLSGFKFDGSGMRYLSELRFAQARAVFMIRYRMLPTKCNFPGRWVGNLCNICNFEDTDGHLFLCPGFQDLVCDVSYEMFWDDAVLNDSVKLSSAASVVVAMIERLEVVQDLAK